MSRQSIKDGVRGKRVSVRPYYMRTTVMDCLGATVGASHSSVQTSIQLLEQPHDLLRLHESHIEDKKCRLLVKHLLDHPSLRELDFSHNLIGDRGARAIGKLLTRSKLEILNMCDNDIRDPGAKAIAHGLSKNSTLLSLNLRLNRLTDEGGQAIGKALLNNNTLRHLHLGANEVTGLTAIALSKVLDENQTLKSLNLSCNSLGEDGGKALEKAMSHNTIVTECDIRLTEVDEHIVSFINQVAWTNQSLEQKKQAKGKKTK